ncbi:MAG: bifunctional riboflavin kinase/FAD synthetase [Candidatus Dormibacteraeota bacterium]|nr:bifunctional riboflavin kinase/FAD synthetase [Candidatus Dormibacteraeota bacterium]
MGVHFGLPTQRLGPSALAVGSFDGLHLGHRAVLERLVSVAEAERLQAAWITFDPHPRCVLDPANCPAQITTLEEKLRLAGALKVKHTIVLEFTPALGALTAEEFMSRLLEAVDLRRLVVGYDFALGRRRAGDVAWLRGHGGEHGYRVEVVEPVRLGEGAVHSSEVRRLVTLGELEKANRLLGREFAVSGLVEPGDQIGRELGWPTVNLAVPPSKLVPGRGIYAGWADTPAGTYQAAISVGYRPTFHKTELRVEAHLLDFRGDLYQQRLELRFVARLRDEVEYPDSESLSAQIARDVEETRRLLAAHGGGG